MITMMWEIQVEKAFLIPSALWFLRERKMITYENITMTKLTVQMAPLLDTKSRLTM